MWSRAKTWAAVFRLQADHTRGVRHERVCMHGSLDDIRGAVAARRARGRGAHASDAGGGTGAGRTGCQGRRRKSWCSNWRGQVRRIAWRCADAHRQAGQQCPDGRPRPACSFPQTHVTMPPFWHARRGRAGARRTGARHRRTTHALAGIGTLVQSDAGSARSAGRHDPAEPEFGRSAAAFHAEAGPARPARAWTARWMRDVRSMPCSARWMACCATPIP